MWWRPDFERACAAFPPPQVGLGHAERFGNCHSHCRQHWHASSPRAHTRIGCETAEQRSRFRSFAKMLLADAASYNEPLWKRAGQLLPRGTHWCISPGLRADVPSGLRIRAPPSHAPKTRARARAPGLPPRSAAAFLGDPRAPKRPGAPPRAQQHGALWGARGHGHLPSAEPGAAMHGRQLAPAGAAGPGGPGGGQALGRVYRRSVGGSPGSGPNS